MKIEEKEKNIGKLDNDVAMMDVEENNVDQFHSNHSSIQILFNEKEKQLHELNEKEEKKFENEKNKMMEAEKQEANVDLEPPVNGDKPVEQYINTVQK